MDAGLVSGYDSTPECAITKLMFLLGCGLSADEICQMMDSDIAGEITKPDQEEAAQQHTPHTKDHK